MGLRMNDVETMEGIIFEKSGDREKMTVWKKKKKKKVENKMRLL